MGQNFGYLPAPKTSCPGKNLLYADQQIYFQQFMFVTQTDMEMGSLSAEHMWWSSHIWMPYYLLKGET